MNEADSFPNVYAGKKVLLVSNGNIDRGGVQNYLLCWVRYAPKGEYQFDWFFPGNIEDNAFADEFRQESVKLIPGQIKLERRTIIGKIQRTIEIYKGIADAIKRGHYDIVHVNTGAISMNAIALTIAKRYKVPQRIAHSHNAAFLSGTWMKFRDVFFRRILLSSVTKCAACSQKAAEYVFGKQASKATIINNTIQTNGFAFSANDRELYRKKLGMENSFVVGHVGRFNEQKNHKFLLKVFEEIVKREPSAKLLLLGTGECEAEVKQQAAQDGIARNICFAGVTDKVTAYMSAMDIFVLPSLFEGFPIVGIEAQCSGLPCVFSDAITREARLSEDCSFVSLDDSKEKWAEEILKKKDWNNIERSNAWKHIASQGYDNSNIKQMMVGLYSN